MDAVLQSLTIVMQWPSLKAFHVLFFFGMQFFQHFSLWKDFNDVFYTFCRHWLCLNLSVQSLTMLVSSGLTSPPPVDININRNSRFFRNKKLDYHYPQTKVIIKVSNHLTR